MRRDSQHLAGGFGRLDAIQGALNDMNIVEDDLVTLGNALGRLAAGIHPSVDPAWSRPVAIRVVDCVLSLNRDYDRFVAPRVEALMRAHPAVRGIGDLAALMECYPSPSAFVKVELRYDHADRARVLAAVVDFVRSLVSGVAPADHETALERWATGSRPADFRRLSIKGFKLAGFQYLRMLFGAQTTKPDKHIITFVSESLSRRVSALEALVLLEAAARRAHLPIRDVDTSIWEIRARGAWSGSLCPLTSGGLSVSSLDHKQPSH